MNNVGRTLGLSAILIAAVLLAGGCSGGESPEVTALKAQVKAFADERSATAANLAEFDTLDYTVFSNQQWERLHESHSADIKVYWPDGHMTEGIEKHTEDLKGMFVFAPDTRVKTHPIRVGYGSVTAVTGVFEGTFTKPMPIGNGKFIPPTGKAFSLPMATFGVWENGTMTEEHLFWDNQTFMKQLGLAK